MADFSITGHLEGVRYGTTCAIVTISENKNGYKKKDGTIIEDTILTWHILFKPYFKKFIASHFHSGMYVAIKAEILPYKIVNGKAEEGFTVIGQTINVAPYPKNIKRERKMFNDSQVHASELPDLENFNAPDF